MSYPGRPQMVPGMGVPPPGMQMQFMGLGGPPPLMSTIMPPHMIGPPMPNMDPNSPTMRGGYRGGGGGGNNQSAVGRSPAFSKRVQEQGTGPAVTVFVGNITERAPDAMIRHILSACGQVVSWKRVQGTSAFGFCEYGSPDSGLRAVRLLHDMELGGKTLVVKVDAKTKVVLDEFKDDRRRKLGSQKPPGNNSPLQDERPPPADAEDSSDYMDDEMKSSDQAALDRISAIMSDYEPDMKNYNPPAGDNKERKMSKAQEKLLKLSHSNDGGPGGDTTPNFDDGEMEEGKRDLITREIGKFREIMKKQEEEKEAERRRKEAKDKERRDKDPTPRSPPGHRRRERTRSPVSPASRNQSRSPPPLPRSSRHQPSPSPPPLPSSRSSRPQPPSRSPTPESTYSNKLRSKGSNNREWRRSHSRSRERDEAPAKRSEREIQKEREMEEEAKERKKQDRKAREKEAAYQERLRNWEGRERRKAKEHGKEREKERRTSEEASREARRLKEFLEDYDDERDDAKFYKGRELARRLALREQEIESDARDRQREKEELEEIRTKIYSDKGCDNPSAEFERIKQEREQQYKPKILVKVEAKAPPPLVLSELRPASPPPQPLSAHNSNSLSGISAPPPPTISSPWRPPPEDNSTSALASPPPPPSYHQHQMQQEDDSQLSAVSQASMPPMDDEPSPVAPASSRGFSGWKSPSQDSLPAVAPPPPRGASPASQPPGVSIPVGKKRKLEIREVFNTEDDEDGSLGSGGSRKRKPLVPLDYGEEKGKKGKEEAGSKASQEEKRKHIKSLIDKIPTDKEALFDFPIDWEAVDSTLMERRIRPWINKKIIEYIGEPEPTLVDFICSKVLVGSPPQGILDDVQMVLDEEAEVFVVKMWRLLIYEIEAKKLGLVK